MPHKPDFYTVKITPAKHLTQTEREGLVLKAASLLEKATPQSVVTVYDDHMQELTEPSEKCLDCTGSGLAANDGGCRKCEGTGRRPFGSQENDY